MSETQIVGTGTNHNRTYLKSMKYRELQQIAKRINVRANGKRNVLIERILNMSISSPVLMSNTIINNIINTFVNYIKTNCNIFDKQIDSDNQFDNEKISEIITSIVNAKTLCISQDTEGLTIIINDNYSNKVCILGDDANFERILGKNIGYFPKLEYLRYNTRFPGEFSWPESVGLIKPVNLKHLVIPYLIDMESTFTNGLHILEFYNGGDIDETLVEIDETEDMVILEKIKILKSLLENKIYDNINTVILTEIDEELHEFSEYDMNIINKIFPSSSIVTQSWKIQYEKINQ